MNGRNILQEKLSVPEGLRSVQRTSHQFGLRSFMMLTVVMAVWFWLFREMTPTELTIFTSFAFATGFLGHLIHTLLRSRRIAGVFSVLVIYNIALALLTAVGSCFQGSLSEAFDAMLDLVSAPAEIVAHASSPQEILFSTVIISGTLLLTPAHAIRPNVINALITSLGVGIWYVAGLLFLSHAA